MEPVVVPSAEKLLKRRTSTVSGFTPAITTFAVAQGVYQSAVIFREGGSLQPRFAAQDKVTRVCTPVFDLRDPLEIKLLYASFLSNSETRAVNFFSDPACSSAVGNFQLTLGATSHTPSVVRVNADKTYSVTDFTDLKYCTTLGLDMIVALDRVEKVHFKEDTSIACTTAHVSEKFYVKDHTMTAGALSSAVVTSDLQPLTGTGGAPEVCAPAKSPYGLDVEYTLNTLDMVFTFVQHTSANGTCVSANSPYDATRHDLATDPTQTSMLGRTYYSYDPVTMTHRKFQVVASNDGNPVCLPLTLTDPTCGLLYHRTIEAKSLCTPATAGAVLDPRMELLETSDLYGADPAMEVIEATVSVRCGGDYKLVRGQDLVYGNSITLDILCSAINRGGTVVFDYVPAEPDRYAEYKCANTCDGTTARNFPLPSGMYLDNGSLGTVYPFKGVVGLSVDCGEDGYGASGLLCDVDAGGSTESTRWKLMVTKERACADLKLANLGAANGVSGAAAVAVAAVVMAVGAARRQ